MIERFKQYVAKEHLLAEGRRVLLAVSGGRDSVTLCHLVSRAGYPFAIAHCNFHLRPCDCDRDEQFVRRLAEKYGVECFVAQFDTHEFAHREHLSVEAAARHLRYGFFEEVCEKEGITDIATAHHRDDAIETFFINLLRGTGIAGIHGILPRNGRVVRPMLCFTREEIDAYVAAERLEWVEDYTNAETVFMRNRIRLRLLPLLREMSPSFDSTMWENIERFREVEEIYDEVVSGDRKRLLKQRAENGGGEAVYLISIDELKELHPLRTRLFELLRLFGFTAPVVDEIIEALEGQSGKRFFSCSHQIVKDRTHLLLSPIATIEDSEYLIPDVKSSMTLPLPFTMSEEDNDGGKIHLPANAAWFDLEELRFPLLLRRWRAGDRFQPFGMRGSRLVSDLLSDNKYTLEDKNRQWLLCDADGKILWVVGLRASSHASVTSSTRRILKINCQ